MVTVLTVSCTSVGASIVLGRAFTSVVELPFMYNESTDLRVALAPGILPGAFKVLGCGFTPAVELPFTCDDPSDVVAPLAPCNLPGVSIVLGCVFS